MAEIDRQISYRSAGPDSRDNRDRGRFTAQGEVERFRAQLDTTSDPGHWLWTGLLTEDGYPRFWLARRPGEARAREVRAHRYAYELFVGPIPEGHTIDHLADCLRPACCHPVCLEPVTNAENLRRRHARRRAQIGATS